MTIEEVKKQINVAEGAVSNALNDLFKVTGLMPHVTVISTDTFCGHIIGVKIEVSI